MEYNKNSKIFGIDMSKKSMQIAIFNEGKNKPELKKLSTDIQGRNSLISLLAKDDIVALETGNLSFLLAKQIQDKIGCRVFVLNAGRLRIIYDSLKKTDKNDSINIGMLVKAFDEDQLPKVHIPSDHEMYMRSLITERDRINRLKTISINALHSIVWNNGLTDVKKSQLYNKLERIDLIEMLKPEYKKQAFRIDKQLLLFDEQLTELEEEQAECLKENVEEVTPTLSMPGIGLQTALTIYAYLGTMDRFDNARQVTYFSGFTPKVDNSGLQEHYGRISKVGPRILRKNMIQAAWAAVRSKKDNIFKQYYEKLAGRRGKARAIVAVARKMLSICYTLYKNRELFKYLDDHDFNSHETVIKKLKRYKII